MYFLPEGYREQERIQYFIDDVTQDRGIVFQPDVYAMAEFLVEMGMNPESIIDVGCGRADKLAAIHKRHPDWQFEGIDHGDNLEWCRTNYEWGLWSSVDLDQVSLPIGKRTDIVICSDVIEHLASPHLLLDALHMGGATVVLSTPERTQTYGTTQYGPPANICHVREWTLDEFRQLLVERGFKVRWIGLTRSSDIDYSCKTTLAIIQS